MGAKLTGDGSCVDPAAMTAEAMAKAKKSETKAPRSLLEHLRMKEKTAHTIDPALERALDGAPAPSSGTKLPKTLQNVYAARPSLEQVFYRGTAIGDRLANELKGVKETVGTVERGFDPEKGGGYYSLIREQVQKSPLDGSVRRPTMLDEVLKTPSPTLPAPAKDAVRRWLRETPLPDRTLPESVCKAIIAQVRMLRLEPKLEGMELVVRLPEATRAAIQKILGEAKDSEPERSKVYDWWLENSPYRSRPCGDSAARGRPPAAPWRAASSRGPRPAAA